MTNTPRTFGLALIAGVTLSLGLVSSHAAPTAAQPAIERSLQCIEDAGSRTLLLAAQLDRLCIAAPTPRGPVDCFVQAQGMFLTDEQGITLCRCSPDDAPIDCYRQVRETSSMLQEDIIALCSPSLVRGLGPSCR